MPNTDKDQAMPSVQISPASSTQTATDSSEVRTESSNFAGKVRKYVHYDRLEG